MIKIMFKSFFKRFFGLFVSMVFVSMLSVGLLCCFGSTIINVKNNYITYVSEYQDMDEQVSTSFASRETLKSVLQDIPEVLVADARLTVDAFIKKEEKQIVGRIFSYNEKDNKIFKRCVTEKIPYVDNAINIGVTGKFARNNNFKLGQTIEIGFLKYYERFHIAEILETPEGIYPRANNYIWSDNHDFGYIYASEQQLSLGLNRIASQIISYLDNLDPQYDSYREYYERVVKEAGVTIPDIHLIGEDFAARFANQILIKNVKGANKDETLQKVTDALKAKGIDVTSSVTRPYMPHIAYMDHALEQVQIASIFLPVFFYSVTMIIVGLFMTQIIKTMTPQIGVFTSIGVGKGEIVRLFVIFSIIISIFAGVFGTGVGFGLNVLMSSIMKKTYSIPTISPMLNVWVVTASILGLLIFAVIATLISCGAIFRITPKDATISNEAKRKPTPKVIQKFIDKAPMNIKLGTNSIVQNPRRFFVSTFSIFASIVLILLSTFFSVSKDAMIDQSFKKRLNYDAQVYLNSKASYSEVESLKTQSFIDEFEDCYYTYLKVDTEKQDNVYLECLAVDPGYNPLITIPNSRGSGSLDVPETGIILCKGDAEKLHVKKGEFIKINNKAIKVMDISFQYFHPITYLSKEQMDALEIQCVSSFILNTNNDKAMMDYLTENHMQSLTVFTASLSKDLHAIFDSINVMIYIMVGFSIGMSFIILAIMSQNALMEMQRQLTVLRAIGFTVWNISNFWTIQSISQLLFSSIFAIPIGALSAQILFSLASSSSQIYPFVFSIPVVLMALGFVALVLISCHLITMRGISRWNIADNTRCRE